MLSWIDNFFLRICVSGVCFLPESELNKLNLIFLILFFLASGCLPQGLLGPESYTEIVILDPDLSTQQTVSECGVKANRYALNQGHDSEIFMGFQKQVNFGECMNTKGFAWGIQ